MVQFLQLWSFIKLKKSRIHEAKNGYWNINLFNNLVSLSDGICIILTLKRHHDFMTYILLDLEWWFIRTEADVWT